MRLQLPKILRSGHVVVRMARQVVVQGIGDRSIAVPTMMLLDGVIFDAHETKMLHVVDQLVEQTPEQARGDDHEYPAGAGKDPRENDNCQRRYVAKDQSIAPRPRRQAAAAQLCRLDTGRLDELLNESANHKGT